jgi:hypothetical protein
MNGVGLLGRQGRKGLYLVVTHKFTVVTIYTTRLNIKNLCIVPTKYIFAVALRINDIKQSIFVMEAERVLCNVGTEI